MNDFDCNQSDEGGGLVVGDVVVVEDVLGGVGKAETVQFFADAFDFEDLSVALVEKIGVNNTSACVGTVGVVEMWEQRKGVALVGSDMIAQKGGFVGMVGGEIWRGGGDEGSNVHGSDVFKGAWEAESGAGAGEIAKGKGVEGNNPLVQLAVDSTDS